MGERSAGRPARTLERFPLFVERARADTTDEMEEGEREGRERVGRECSSIYTCIHEDAYAVYACSINNASLSIIYFLP